MTRLLFFGHSAQLSGAEVALVTMLPALKTEHDIEVLLGEEGPLVQALESVAVPVAVLQMPDVLVSLRRDSGPRAFLRAAGSLVSYEHKLLQLLRQRNPDVVYFNTLRAALLGAWAVPLLDAAAIWHVRDRISSDYLSRGQAWAARLMMRCLPVTVIANSRATAGCLPVSSHVVPSPVHADFFKCRRGENQDDTFRIVMVGRISPWKGQHVALKAFAEAFRGGREELHFLGAPLFGEDDYAARLVKDAERLGVASQVKWLGHRVDVAAYLGTCDVLVHASVLPEPFGQVVVQGMAAGLPTVAADAGGPAEIITHLSDGLLYPPGDVQELSRHLSDLRENSRLRQKLGSAGTQTARQYAVETVAPALSDVIQRSLVADRPRWSKRSSP